MVDPVGGILSTAVLVRLVQADVVTLELAGNRGPIGVLSDGSNLSPACPRHNELVVCNCSLVR